MQGAGWSHTASRAPLQHLEAGVGLTSTLQRRTPRARLPLMAGVLLSTSLAAYPPPRLWFPMGMSSLPHGARVMVKWL